jgi:hypothetical protein
MPTQLITDWEELETIKRKIKGRKEFLITVNDKYFNLIQYDNFTHGANKVVLFEPQTPNVLSDSAGRVYSLWVNYDIDFFNIDSNIVRRIKPKILQISAEENASVLLPVQGLYSTPGRTNYGALDLQEVWSSFINDTQHFRLSVSLHLVDVARSPLNYLSGRVSPYINIAGLSVDQHQLMLKFTNPTIHL